MAGAVVPIIASVAAAAAGAGVAALTAPKTQKPPASPPMPTRNQALGNVLSSDSSFRRRQGGAATMITGAGGAEAPSPGVKSLLGQ